MILRQKLQDPDYPEYTLFNAQYSSSTIFLKYNGAILFDSHTAILYCLAFYSLICSDDNEALWLMILTVPTITYHTHYHP